VRVRKKERRRGVIYEELDVAELDVMMPRIGGRDNCLSMLGVALFLFFRL
jgi:hypothetical protein